MKIYYFLIILSALILGGCKGDHLEADAYGTFESTEVTVSAMANGRILQLNIEEGQLVDSGQVVGYIDTTDLYLKKLQAIDQRSATSSRISDLEAQIAVQDQNRENLMIEKQRLENLFKAGAATQKQLDDLNSNLRIIERQIATIRSQFSGINNQVGGISQQIAQLDESIKNARIVNPVTGTVLVKYAEPEEVTIYGRSLYKIADLREMILRVYISGAQLPRVNTGQEVEVRYDKDETMINTIPGTVSWISTVAEFTPKTIQTKDERVNLVYAVKIRVKNDGALKIGMPGEIRLLNK